MNINFYTPAEFTSKHSGHSEVVMPQIAELLKKNKINIIYCAYSDSNKHFKNIIPLINAKYLRYILYAINKYLKINFQYHSTYNSILDFFCSRKIRKKNELNVFTHIGFKKSITKSKKLGNKNLLFLTMEHLKTYQEKQKKEFKKYSLKNPKKYLKKFDFLKNVDYFIAPSNFVKESYIKQNVSDKKIFVIPFGINHKKFVPPTKKNHHKNTIFCTCAYFTPLKGIQYLLEAWLDLNLKNAKLILIGDLDSNTKKILSPLLKKTKNKNATITGRTSSLEWYQKSDVYINPSLSEGSAKTIYEAMSCGLPCIVTKESGSIITDEKEGFVGNAKDIEFLKKKILYYIKKPEKIKEHGISAREKIVKNYTLKDYSKKVEKQIKYLIGE